MQKAADTKAADYLYVWRLDNMPLSYHTALPE